MVADRSPGPGRRVGVFEDAKILRLGVGTFRLALQHPAQVFEHPEGAKIPKARTSRRCEDLEHPEGAKISKIPKVRRSRTSRRCEDPVAVPARPLDPG
jgi:hypothetical protein